MNEPESNDLMAFVYIEDIDHEKKQSLAVQNVLDEEIESVIIIDVKNKMVDIAMENREWGRRKKGDSFPLNDEFRKALLKDVIKEDRT